MPVTTVECIRATRSRWTALRVSVIVLGVLVLASSSLAQRGGGSHSSAALGGHFGGGHFSATSASRSVSSRGVVATRATLAARGARTGWMSNSRATRGSGTWGRNVWVGPQHSFGPSHRRHYRRSFVGGLGFFGSGLGGPFFGFWNNYSEDCEPLADGTLPPDCNVLGDWAGDAGEFNGDQEESEDQGDANAQDPDPGQAWVPTVYEATPAEIPEPAVTPKPLTLLYMKNGFSYGATNYWLAGDGLHYVTSYGGENSVSVDQIDMRKTTEENADRGVPFVLGPKAR
ncbi:MAG TPA: hypothetical protein VMF66_10675 [Candidatus Acidoferrum sp.]|nr:hypothetical protein [Candidatus Acidoferrum sp.]